MRTNNIVIDREIPHEKRFGGDITRLRAPDRVGRLEIERVVALSLEGMVLKNANNLACLNLYGVRITSIDRNRS